MMNKKQKKQENPFKGEAKEKLCSCKKKEIKVKFVVTSYVLITWLKERS